MCQRKNCPFANLKILKVYKLIAFLKTLQKLNRNGRKVQPWDQANRWKKLGLVWRNRKKISQIINAYLYLPFFLLIILCLPDCYPPPPPDFFWPKWHKPTGLMPFHSTQNCLDLKGPTPFHLPS